MGTRVHVLISGMVQGVGFRHATFIRAHKSGLTGWVRNLSDGHVEAVFEGAESVLTEMVAWCWNGPHLSNVTGVQENWSNASKEFDEFEIIF